MNTPSGLGPDGVERSKRFTFPAMNLNYNLVSLIDTLGIIQGIILGVILFVLHKETIKSTAFLGLFILTYSLDLLPDLLDDLGVTKYYPQLFLLPFNYTWLLFASFYIYVQKISIIQQKPTYWLLYPGLIHFLAQIVFFFLPYPVKLQLDNSVEYDLFLLTGFFYSLLMAVLTVRWINRNKEEVYAQFSDTSYKELRWAKVYLLVSIAYMVILATVVYFTQSLLANVFFSSINVALLYWVSIHGILQPNIKPVIRLTDTENPADVTILSQSSHAVSIDEALKEFAGQLTDFMNESIIYKQPELTIVDVAEKMGAHPKKISTVINKVYGQNFNTFVNQYRVEKVLELLRSDAIQTLSIEGIGTEVGFQSKSSFYAAFKKVTGVTPGKYRAE